MRAPRGFTLVELMVVVAIIAILATVMIGLTNGSAGGTNAEIVSNQVTTSLNYARMRAVSTRAFHEVEVKPQSVTLFEAWDTLNNRPLTGLKMPAGPNQGWRQVSSINLPSNNVTIWNAQAAVDTAGGAIVAQNAALDFFIFYKPDGSSTGGSLFVSDIGQYKQFRILIYKATGSSYARKGF